MSELVTPSAVLTIRRAQDAVQLSCYAPDTTTPAQTALTEAQLHAGLILQYLCAAGHPVPLVLIKDLLKACDPTVGELKREELVILLEAVAAQLQSLSFAQAAIQLILLLYPDLRITAATPDWGRSLTEYGAENRRVALLYPPLVELESPIPLRTVYELSATAGYTLMEAGQPAVRLSAEQFHLIRVLEEARGRGQKHLTERELCIVLQLDCSLKDAHIKMWRLVSSFVAACHKAHRPALAHLVVYIPETEWAAPCYAVSPSFVSETNLASSTAVVQYGN